MERTTSFWEFSVSTYRRAGVADDCLWLQDRLGVDVNLLLYCCWFGCTRGTLVDETLGMALSFSQPWADEVVRPLRATRTWMKIAGCGKAEVPTDECMALRDRIKAAELEAERLQQKALEGLAPTPCTGSLGTGTRVANTASNLRGYLEHCNVRLDDPSLSKLARIVTAAIDGAEEETVLTTLRNAFEALS